jgi:hypothetical protein
VWGTGTGSAPGVYGESGAAASTSIGVSGYGWGYGVYGVGDPPTDSYPAGGVYAEGKSNANGVTALSEAGTGVEASGGQIGVRAISTQTGNTGVGLKVDGRSIFRTAGVATVPSGSNKKTVTLSGVTSTDMVLATVQGTTAGFWVVRAMTASGKLTLFLNKAPVAPMTVKVAYFVISVS